MSSQQTYSSKTGASSADPNNHQTSATHEPHNGAPNEKTPPLYWSVLHHKNVSESAPTIAPQNIPEAIHERQPFLSDGGTGSTLTGYESTTGSPRVSPPTLPQKQQSSGSDTKSSKWGRIKDAVDSQELFIKYMPDKNGEGTSSNRKWSDMIHITHELTLKECLLLFILLLAIGAVAYSYVFEQWPILDSLYFTVILLTTVGYGDVTPQTSSGKIFASVFALGGIVLLGLALGVVGSHLVEAEIEATEKVKSKTSNALERAFTKRSRRKNLTIENLEALNGRPLPRSVSANSLESVGSESTCSSVYGNSPTHSVSSTRGNNPLEEDERRTPSCPEFSTIVQRHLPGFLPLIIGGLAMGLLEHWWWDDAIYYCVVTATTIGFGDIHPQTTEAKWCAILFVPIVVAATGYILGNLASFIVEQRRAKYNRRLWRSELKLEDIEALDEAHDGGVTELEYIKFMLVAMKKIDASLFDELREQFVKLDMTGDGMITPKDLKIMATRRLRKVSHKLRMHEYKKQLTKVASLKRSGFDHALIDVTEKSEWHLT